MRYYYKKPSMHSSIYGSTYKCNHSVYNECTLGDFFSERAGNPIEGLYPTVLIRQIMWGLKMKPLKREQWETYFDRRTI